MSNVQLPMSDVKVKKTKAVSFQMIRLNKDNLDIGYWELNIGHSCFFLHDLPRNLAFALQAQCSLYRKGGQLSSFLQAGFKRLSVDRIN
jgi:hypothetical protein